MIIKTSSSGDWVTYQPLTGEFQADTLVGLIGSTPENVLRDHHRSRVDKVNFEGEYYVIKSPNNKNKSRWIRFTTLYRDSEVLKDLKSQLLLRRLNIETVRPIAALERRRFGMVIDSKIIYRFREGREISVTEYPEMVSIMNTLHSHGYLHDDPHTKNFLQQNGEVFVIDCKPRFNFFGKAGIAHNFITLARRSSHSQQIYDLAGSSPSNSGLYKFINSLIDMEQYRRSIKNSIKVRLGIDYRQKNKS